MPSQLNAAKPLDNVPASKADFRDAFSVIKTELEHGGFIPGPPSNYPAANESASTHFSGVDAALGTITTKLAHGGTSPNTPTNYTTGDNHVASHLVGVDAALGTLGTSPNTPTNYSTSDSRLTTHLVGVDTALGTINTKVAYGGTSPNTPTNYTTGDNHVASHLVGVDTKFGTHDTQLHHGGFFTNLAAGSIERKVGDRLSDTLSIRDFGAKGDAVRIRGVASTTAGSNVITLSSPPPANGTNYQGYVGNVAAVKGAGQSIQGQLLRFYSGKIASISTNGLTITITNNDTDGGYNLSSGTGAINTVSNADIFLGSNDTSAFQLAATTLRTVGRGSLYIPTGTYLVTDVTAFSSRIEIYGDGYASFLQNVRNTTSAVSSQSLTVIGLGNMPGGGYLGTTTITAGSEATTVPVWTSRCYMANSTAALAANDRSFTLATPTLKSITAYGQGGATGSSFYARLTSNGHGFGEHDHVYITGMGAPWDGWWRIVNVTTNTFDLRYKADPSGSQEVHFYTASFTLSGTPKVQNRTDASFWRIGDMVQVRSLDYTASNTNGTAGSTATDYYKIPNNMTFALIKNIVGQVVTLDRHLGWSSGTNVIEMAKPLPFKDNTTNTMAEFAYGISIHDLRIGGANLVNPNGSVFFRSKLYNLWADECEWIFQINFMGESQLYNVQGTCTLSVFELKIGSHDSTISNIDVVLDRPTFGDGRGLICIGEAARDLLIESFVIHAPDMFRATGPVDGFTSITTSLLQLQRGANCVVRNGTLHVENTTATPVNFFRGIATIGAQFLTDPLFSILPVSDCAVQNVKFFQGAAPGMLILGSNGGAGPAPLRCRLIGCEFSSTFSSAGATAVNGYQATQCGVVDNTFGFTLGGSPVGDLVLSSSCAGTHVSGNRINGFAANSGVNSVLTNNIAPQSNNDSYPWPYFPAERIRDQSRAPNNSTTYKGGAALTGVYHPLLKKFVYAAGTNPYDNWLDATVTDPNAKVAAITGKAIRNQTWTAVGSEYRNDSETFSGKPIAIIRDDNTVMPEGTVGSLAKGQWGWNGTTVFIRLREDVAPAAVAALPATGDNSAGLRYIPSGTTYLPVNGLPAPSIWSGPGIMQPGQVIAWDGTTLPAGLTLEKGVIVMSTTDGSQKRVTVAGTTGGAPQGVPTANTTSGSKTVTNLPTTAYLSVGQLISIAGALTGARICSMSATQIVVDTNAGGTVTGVAVTYPAPTLT